MIPTQFSYPKMGLLPRLAAIGCAVALAGCNLQAEEEAKPPRQPTEVGIVTAMTEDVPLVNELAGRTSPFETSEVRPQVSGIIEARSFTEGAFVKKGDTLGAIARKYGTSVSRICQLSGIKSTSILRIGQKLRVR
jgi:membrane fusion protein (multidrug efflux system)